MTGKELEQIYNEAYKAVYWTALSLLKNESDAEDVVQDTFVSFIESYSDMTDTSKAKALLKKMDIDQDVFYAEINWDVLLKFAKTHKIEYQPISKFPRVRRDLALLIDKSVTYAQLEEVARRTEPKHIVEVGLFDVYEGKNLEPGKISYALSFELEDTEKTMTDKQIDKIMQKLIMFYEKELGAKVR